MKYNRWKRNPNSDAEFATEVRKHYAACVSYADAQVGKVLAKLDDIGARKNTIVILWGDHGWHLGEHSVWGKHTLFEESLHAPLIISYPTLPQAGTATDAMAETLDVFPTLCDLCELPVPEFTHGVSLAPQLKNPKSSGHPAVAYHGKADTIRTETHRLTLHKDGFVELYDHSSPAKETRNIASDHPELVKELTAKLQQRLKLK